MLSEYYPSIPKLNPPRDNDGTGSQTERGLALGGSRTTIRGRVHNSGDPVADVDDDSGQALQEGEQTVDVVQEVERQKRTDDSAGGNSSESALVSILLWDEVGEQDDECGGNQADPGNSSEELHGTVTDSGHVHASTVELGSLRSARARRLLREVLNRVAGRGGEAADLITRNRDQVRACLLYTSPSPRDRG